MSRAAKFSAICPLTSGLCHLSSTIAPNWYRSGPYFSAIIDKTEIGDHYLWLGAFSLSSELKVKGAFARRRRVARLPGLSGPFAARVIGTGETCMNAHAPAWRHPRAPLAYHRAPPRAASPRYRQALALTAPKGAIVQRPADRRVCEAFWWPASAACLSFASSVMAHIRGLRVTTIRKTIDGSTLFRLAAAAVGGAVITLAIINNHRADNDLSGYSVVRNETVVYRQTATRKVPVEDDGEPADLDAEEIPCPRAIRARFRRSNS